MPYLERDVAKHRPIERDRYTIDVQEWPRIRMDLFFMMMEQTHLRWPEHESDLNEEDVEHDDEKRTGNRSIGRRTAHTFCTSRGVIPLVTPDDTNSKSEKDRFDDAGQIIAEFYTIYDAGDKVIQCHAGLDLFDDPGAHECQQVRIDREHR